MSYPNTKRPLIGLVSSRDGGKMVMNLTYMNSVWYAGGLPVILAYTTDPDKLAEYAETAWRHLTADGRPAPDIIPVVMGGGISQHEAPAWQDRIASLTDPAVPAVYTVADMPPVFGAVVEACKQAQGSKPDFEALKRAFAASFLS